VCVCAGVSACVFRLRSKTRIPLTHCSDAKIHDEKHFSSHHPQDSFNIPSRVFEDVSFLEKKTSFYYTIFSYLTDLAKNFVRRNSGKLSEFVCSESLPLHLLLACNS
jgi:hypothetical protein